MSDRELREEIDSPSDATGSWERRKTDLQERQGVGRGGSYSFRSEQNVGEEENGPLGVKRSRERVKMVLQE